MPDCVVNRSFAIFCKGLDFENATIAKFPLRGPPDTSDRAVGNDISKQFGLNEMGSGLGNCKCLIQVPEDVVEGFEANRNAYHVRGYPGGNLLLFTELSMGG
jgi:hypothetical protein